MGMNENRSPSGLVVIDEGWGQGALAPWLGALILVVTGAVVLGTALVDTLMPLERPKLLGTELETDEAMRSAANLWDGSKARLFERDYDLTSRVRSTASEPYGQFLLRYLHETSGSVLRGFDGWLFQEARIDYPTDDPDLGQRRSVEMIRAVERRFAGHGVRFIVLPLPRKCVVGADQLPYGVRSRAQLDRGMVEAIRASGVETVDVPAAFEAWQGAALFRAADTHWTAEGMRLAAEETARASGLSVPESERFGELFDTSELRKPMVGDLFVRLGLTADEDDPRLFDGGLLVVRAREGRDQERLVEFRQSLREAALVTGTSFSTTFFPSFVAHYIGRPVIPGGGRGVRTFRALANALAKAPYGGDGAGPRALPPLVFAEFPGHHLLQPSRKPERWTYVQGVVDLLRLVPATGSVDVGAADTVMGDMLPGHVAVLDRSRQLVGLGPGACIRSGDGTTELVLDLEASTSGVKLSLTCGRFAYTEELPVGRSVRRFPLMGDGELSPALRVVLNRHPGASVTVHEGSVQVNGTIVQGADFEMPLPKVLDQGAGIQQEFRLDGPIELDRYDCLVLNGGSYFPLEEATVQCFLGLEPVGEAWRTTGVAQAADWALNLGGLRGQEIDRVVLEGRYVLKKRPGLTPRGPLFETAYLVGLREASARRGLGPILLKD